MIDHGRSRRELYHWPDIWSGGPNTTCSIVLHHIMWMKEQNMILPDSTIDILLDNTAKENKCATVLAFGGDLVLKKIFQNVLIYCMMQGMVM